MYKWIEISDPSSYQQLVDSVPADYQPKTVAKRLGECLTDSVKGVLIETGYVDKDYRSTFYSYYAKKGREYRADCVRLHFFDGLIRFDPTTLALESDDQRLSDHYYGFMVLRPTMFATVGRSLLSPDIRRGADGLVVSAEHKVHLLGYSLVVSGFPSMDQHADIAVCAHVACWAVLRHYSQRFPKHGEVLLHDVTRMAHDFDPGGLVPSNGLAMAEAERVFQAAGTYPLPVYKRVGEEDTFYSQMMAYLESGFPLFVGMKKHAHAVVVMGYAWDHKGAGPVAAGPFISAWKMAAGLNAVDDNQLPYVKVNAPGHTAADTKYTAEDFDRFIVALPEKIHYPATAVERHSQTMYDLLAGAMEMPPKHEVVVRFFVTTIARFRHEVRERASQFAPSLIDVVMNMPAAQFVWVVEYATQEQWAAGNIAARVVLDATSTLWDPAPAWLAHGIATAIVFNRVTASGAGASVIDVSTPHAAPLGRMELNLRRVRSP